MLFWRGGNCKGNPLYHTVSPSPTFYFNSHTSTSVPEAPLSTPKPLLRFRSFPFSPEASTRFRSFYFEFRHLVTFRNYAPPLAFSFIPLSSTSVPVLTRFRPQVNSDFDSDSDFDFGPAGILVYFQSLSCRCLVILSLHRNSQCIPYPFRNGAIVYYFPHAAL